MYAVSNAQGSSSCVGAFSFSCANLTLIFFCLKSTLMLTLVKDDVGLPAKYI